MSIIAGKVSYGRVRKDDDFGINRKADAELSFTAEGEAEAVIILNKAGTIVVNKGHELLALAVSKDAKPTVVVETASPGDKGKIAEKEAAGSTLAAEKAAEKLAKDKDKAKAGKKSAAKVEADEVIDEEPAIEALEDPLEDEAPAPITDAALTDAIAKQNQKTPNPPAIRLLIQEFSDAETPVQSRKIPPEKRAAFLVKLAKVTAVAK